MTAGRTIDYEALEQDAMRSVVRSILIDVAANGLPGDHHFYVSFDTQAPGVTVSRRLKEKYPDEMTIVLQHRFWDLSIAEDRFEVKLTFDGIPERLVIPFKAIRVFFDPSVRYALQFDGAQRDGSDGDAGQRSLVLTVNPQERGRGMARSNAKAAERKPRTPRRPRIEKVADADAGGAAEGQRPRPVPVASRPATVMPVSPSHTAPQTTPAAVPSGQPPAAADVPVVQPEPATAVDGGKPADPPKDGAGATIVRLDTFRKK